MGTFDRLNKLNQRRETIVVDNSTSPLKKVAQITKAPKKMEAIKPKNKQKSKSKLKTDQAQKMRRFTISLPDRIVKSLIEISSNRELELGKSVTKSDVIREALDYYFTKRRK